VHGGEVLGDEQPQAQALGLDRQPVGDNALSLARADPAARPL